jgi:hypothetical protein
MQEHSTKTIMHFPVLPGSDHTKKKASWKREKYRLYHAALASVLEYFAVVQRAGGISTYSAAHKEVKKFMPALVMVMQDIPEGQLLAGLYNSCKAQVPCRLCMMPGKDFHRTDRRAVAKARNFQECENARTRAITAIDAARAAGVADGTIGKAQMQLKQLSCKLLCT